MPISKLSEAGYISAAYIREDYQRKGIVKILEEELIKFLKTLGIQYVKVNFLYNNIGEKMLGGFGILYLHRASKKIIL